MPEWGRLARDRFDSLPMTNRSHYTLVGEHGAASPRKKPALFSSASSCLASKVFWRTLLVIFTFALVANLFNPAHRVLTQNVEGGSSLVAADKKLHSTLPATPGNDVDWTQYAYCQYVTTPEYLCNSVMAFESLVRVGAKAERLMMYPERWTVDTSTKEGRLLIKARDEYGARLVPIQIIQFMAEPTWKESANKLLAFNQTRYKRVLSLDSDATILKPMDELFLLPQAPVAMPRAYWLDKPGCLSSQLVLIEPSNVEVERILEAFKTRKSNDFDMEIVNNIYGDSCMIIPHRRYDLLTGEFRSKKHTDYLGTDREPWDARKVYEEAKFVHFSDWPLPKPWVTTSTQQIKNVQPTCDDVEGGKQDCSSRDLWLQIYDDFRTRRERVCGSEFKAVVL